MRWPFWRRETPVAGPTAESAGDADAPAVSAAPAAWATLPGLQRTVHDGPALTAPSGDLRGDLADRWTPNTTLELLGHELGGLGPSGTIGLTGTPIEDAGTGPEMVDRPARTALPVQRSGGTGASSAVPDPGPFESSPLAVLPPAPAPYRAAVVEAGPPAGVQRSLISAADPVGDGRHSLAAGAGAKEVSPPPQPAVTPPAEGADSAMQDASTTLQRLASSAGSDASLPVRRLGLGAPIQVANTRMPLQRSVERANGGEADPAPTGGLDRPRVAVQRLSLGELPVRRPPTAMGLDASAMTGTDPGASPSPAATQSGTRSADSAMGETTVAGTVPATVLTGAIDVSRLAVGADPGPNPGRVLARRLAGRVESTSIQRDVDTASGLTSTHPVPPSDQSELPDRPDAIPPEVADAPRTVRPAPTWARVVAQADGTLPVQREAAEVRLRVARQATGVAQAVTSIRLQRSIESTTTPPSSFLSLAGALPLARAQTPPPTTSPERLDVQRAVDVEHSEATSFAAPMRHLPTTFEAAGSMTPNASAGEFDLAIQRAADDSATGTPPPAVATSTPWGGGLAGGSEKDLDELARRLYDRIRRRLSHELLADRERAGMLTDLR